MSEFLTSLIKMDGYTFLLIGIVALVIGLNANQYRSKRWKPVPLIVLMTIFSLMSLTYLYFLFQ